MRTSGKCAHITNVCIVFPLTTQHTYYVHAVYVRIYVQCDYLLLLCNVVRMLYTWILLCSVVYVQIQSIDQSLDCHMPISTRVHCNLATPLCTYVRCTYVRRCGISFTIIWSAIILECWSAYQVTSGLYRVNTLACEVLVRQHNQFK